MVIMGKEAIILKNAKFNFNSFQAYILERIKNVDWNVDNNSDKPKLAREEQVEVKAYADANGDAPGSMWCTLYLSDYWVSQIEATCGCKVYPEFYLWNFLKYKKLHLHKDVNTFGYGRNSAGVIPIQEEFIINIHDDSKEHNIVHRQQYGPGKVLLLNNTEYFHSGDVISDTRISLHFYLDLILPKKEDGKWSMQELLDRGKTKDEIDRDKL